MDKIPGVVTLISILGILPLMAGVFALFKLPFIHSELNTFLHNLALVYAGLILSFIGGCLFGFECVSKSGANIKRTWLAILPTLLALCALIVTNFSASILAVGFLLVYEFDRKSRSAGVAPDWWLSLRFPLTATVIFLLSIIGFFHGN